MSWNFLCANYALLEEHLHSTGWCLNYPFLITCLSQEGTKHWGQRFEGQSNILFDGLFPRLDTHGHVWNRWSVYANNPPTLLISWSTIQFDLSLVSDHGHCCTEISRELKVMVNGQKQNGQNSSRNQPGSTLAFFFWGAPGGSGLRAKPFLTWRCPLLYSIGKSHVIEHLLRHISLLVSSPLAAEFSRKFAMKLSVQQVSYLNFGQ